MTACGKKEAKFSVTACSTIAGPRTPSTLIRSSLFFTSSINFVLAIFRMYITAITVWVCRPASVFSITRFSLTIFFLSSVLFIFNSSTKLSFEAFTAFSSLGCSTERFSTLRTSNRYPFPLISSAAFPLKIPEITDFSSSAFSTSQKDISPTSKLCSISCVFLSGSIIKRESAVLSTIPSIKKIIQVLSATRSTLFLKSIFPLNMAIIFSGFIK